MDSSNDCTPATQSAFAIHSIQNNLMPRFMRAICACSACERLSASELSEILGLPWKRLSLRRDLFDTKVSFSTGLDELAVPLRRAALICVDQ